MPGSASRGTPGAEGAPGHALPASSGTTPADRAAARPSRLLAWLRIAGLGALIGATIGLWQEAGPLLEAREDIATQQWDAQGLHHLAGMALAGPVRNALLWCAGGLALFAVIGLLLALRRGGAPRSGGLVRKLTGALATIGLLAAGALLAADLQLANAGTLDASGRPNVVWIVIDALRADHLGCYGYDKPTSPFMDGLAKDGVLFARAISQESYTMASAASYFTSTYPPLNGVLYDMPTIDLLPRPLTTVAEVMRDSGYDTAAFVFNPHLYAEFRFDQGFRVYDDRGTAATLADLTDDVPIHRMMETVAPMRAKLDPVVEAMDRDTPKLLYLHYRDVHGPYVPPPPYHLQFVPRSWNAAHRSVVDRAVRRPASSKGFEWPYESELLDFVLSQYDGEIRYTDEGLKELFAFLEEQGITRENTLFLITADHGEDFQDPHPGDPGGWSHGRTLYMEQVHVPLVVLPPGVHDDGRVIEMPVELVDLGPTILDMIGLGDRTPEEFQGRSLAPALQGRPVPPIPIHSGGNFGRGLVISEGHAFYRFEAQVKDQGRYYALRPEADDAPIYGEELYDLRIDPEQREDLLGADPALSTRMATDLDAWLSRGADLGTETKEYGEETRLTLQSLGYLGSDGG